MKSYSMGVLVLLVQVSEARPRPRRRRLESFRSCNTTKTYVASAWELDWREHIDEWASNWEFDGPACTRMRLQKEYIDVWLALHAKRNVTGPEAPLPKFHHKVIGFHQIKSDCEKAKKHVPIEPLVGFLRHPLHHCFTMATSSLVVQPYRVAKEYMFPPFRDEVVPPPRQRRDVLAFYFDLGASTYRAGAGGASMSWFVEEYAQRGIVFDRILAWEAHPQNTSTLFADFDAFPLERLSYFNTLADPTEHSKMNPLTMLRDLATPDDFVVLKIDIDHNPAENAFVREIIQDASLSDRIDELYWENHVKRNPMESQGWQHTPGLFDVDEDPPSFAATASLDLEHRRPVRSANDITHSYELFHALRERGIRAHSWV